MDHEHKQCRARWFTEIGEDYNTDDRECRELAHAEVDGVPLCWVHHATVVAGRATLGEVVRGTRVPLRPFATVGGQRAAAQRRRKRTLDEIIQAGRAYREAVTP